MVFGSPGGTHSPSTRTTTSAYGGGNDGDEEEKMLHRDRPDIRSGPGQVDWGLGWAKSAEYEIYIWRRRGRKSKRAVKTPQMWNG